MPRRLVENSSRDNSKKNCQLGAGERIQYSAGEGSKEQDWENIYEMLDRVVNKKLKDLLKPGELPISAAVKLRGVVESTSR